MPASAHALVAIGEIGLTAPGPGYYPQHPGYSQGRAYKHIDGGKASFRSHSLQRPSSKSPNPGAGTYSPNMQSVYPNRRDSGAMMRGHSARFATEKQMTSRKLGPGCYPQTDRTLYVEAQKSVQRSSRSSVGFGSTSAQRALPFYGGDTPSPGYNQPRVGVPKRRPVMTPRTPRGTALDGSLRTPLGSARTPRGGEAKAAAAGLARAPAPAAGPLGGLFGGFAPAAAPPVVRV